VSSPSNAFNVLFDILSAYKARVWDLDISVAIRSLLNQMRTKGYVDFERSGVALLSSAIIFRRKTEELLRLERPPQPAVESQAIAYERLILPINLPIRTPHSVVDSNELFTDLVELLTKVLSERKGPVESTEVAEDLVVPDVFLEGVEQRVTALGERIALATEHAGRVMVMDLFKGLDYLEAVRTFIVLLFVLSSMEYEIKKEGDELWIVKEQRSTRA